jgi:hypothetical protein
MSALFVEHPSGDLPARGPQYLKLTTGKKASITVGEDILGRVHVY